MNTTEAQRLAAAAHMLRPDWPIDSLRTFIEMNLKARAYRDAALALTWVACDAETRTPKRVVEAGPWWQVDPTSEQRRQVIAGSKCHRCSWFHPPGAECLPFTPAKPETASEHAATARAALDAAPPPRRYDQEATTC